jgi:hypothetical protein
MILIQYVLILGAGCLLMLFLRNHGTTRASASAKLCFLAFLGFSVFAILRPADISELAHWTGVGRGTDLLVYGTVTGLAFVTVHTYLRFKDLQVRHAQLARVIALRDARASQSTAPSQLPASRREAR